MNLFEDTNPHSLRQLLSEIHSRTTALPDFQRDFVWEPGATLELICSIAKSYPAGSLLRVRDTRRLFAARHFEGAPPLDGARHTFLVLDGQQRLTSLYQAFYGTGEHRYFVRLNDLIAGKDFEEAISHSPAGKRWELTRRDIQVQARELLLPLSVLNHSGGFLSWMLDVLGRVPAEARPDIQAHLMRFSQSFVQTIENYHFPVVTLAEHTSVDALCTIFETLNRTGVKLGVFELLTARFWPKNVKLRALWAAAQQRHRILEDFDVDPYYLLQAISLASRSAPS